MRDIIIEVFNRGEIDLDTEQRLETSIAQQHLTVQDLEALDLLLLALFNRAVVWRYGETHIDQLADTN